MKEISYGGKRKREPIATEFTHQHKVKITRQIKSDIFGTELGVKIKIDAFRRYELDFKAEEILECLLTTPLEGLASMISESELSTRSRLLDLIKRIIEPEVLLQLFIGLDADETCSAVQKLSVADRGRLPQSVEHLMAGALSLSSCDTSSL